MFYFGSQYYRPPNPRPEDWERDLDTLADLGFNIIKIWAMWTWTHRAPGEFDFSDLLRLLDLAGQRGLHVLVNTIPENAPYWLEAMHPEARFCDNTGVRIHLQARPNTPCGGWPGLCLDNEPVRLQAAEWFRALGAELSGHEALYGYDIWNETFFEPAGYFPGRRFCYCKATVEKFRRHLREKYASLDALNDAWVRRYTDWDQVEPPRFFGSYPDWFDWTEWRLSNQVEQMAWRIKSIKDGDPRALISSHGICGTLGLLPTHLNPDWAMAEQVQQWGLSSFPGDAAPLSWSLARVDLTRSCVKGTPGKRFWQTELQGGRLNGFGNAERPGAMAWGPLPRPEDYRMWNWTALAGGAKGLLYWQWRNEILGPESPGFGLVSLDGSPNENTEHAAWFARFVREHPQLESADPIDADVAIVVADEAQIFDYISDGDTRLYTEAVMGAHAALVDGNYNVDFARPEDLAGYRAAYLPLPTMLKRQTADALRAFVRQGGLLVCEACPAHFVEGGFCSPVVPGQGLDELFGARASEVEASTDGLHVIWDGAEVPAPVHQMRLEPSGAETIAHWSDGPAALVANRFGRGTAVLIGSYPSIAYARDRTAAAANLIRSMLARGGCTPAVSTDRPLVKARLHRDGKASRLFLYVINEATEAVEATVAIADDAATFTRATLLPDGSELEVEGGSITLHIPARDGCVVELS